ncbi:diacylglycerol kinase family protein [Nodosilinea sp. E11]|uniref:diacylglycerol kinase family protein n=1 Tax=Nodosilinea sp. E11 TaxID=3037479 RepID=UPI002934781A|nr:diacylglycerol kinase family protein [Nodosilinea sp. E11]WOD39184.1 diacylglycerol kinase family protein [Nodosilinea sp. E11]
MSLYSEKSESAVPAPKGSLNPINRSLSLQVATNLFTSFQYAWQGVAYAFRTQRNFRIHVVVGSFAVSLAIALGLAPVELAVIILTCGIVLTLELINTALESVVDLTVEQTYHELAKIAKDCAAAAVLISALIALLVAACLLLPPLWQLLQPQLF